MILAIHQHSSKFSAVLRRSSGSLLLAVTLSGHGKTKATLPSVELPNVDSADSNAVLLRQNQDVCLISNLKHVRASHLASDLGKTNVFAMLIGSTEMKTFFHCEERSCIRKSLTSWRLQAVLLYHHLEIIKKINK